MIREVVLKCTKLRVFLVFIDLNSHDFDGFLLLNNRGDIKSFELYYVFENRIFSRDFYYRRFNIFGISRAFANVLRNTLSKDIEIFRIFNLKGPVCPRFYPTWLYFFGSFEFQPFFFVELRRNIEPMLF